MMNQDRTIFAPKKKKAFCPGNCKVYMLEGAILDNKPKATHGM